MEKETDKVFEAQYKGESYLDDYETFMKNLESQGGLMAAGEVGEMIVRMSSYFSRHNLILGRSLKLFNSVSKEVYSTVEDGGKPISAAKAEIMAAATTEAAAYHEARVHIQNLEQNINALKALQRGILNEYSHSAA